MANLTPVEQWSDVVQHETTDLVLGGPGGPMNQQAQSLLNRTEVLKRDAGKVKVSETDAEADFLGVKLIAGTNITFTVGVDVDGRQTITISSAGGSGAVDTTGGTLRWVRFLTGAGSGAQLRSSGSPAPFPNLDFHSTTGIWANANVLTVNQTPTRRVFANPIIDQIMRLDNLTGEYMCRFFSMRLVRDFTATPIVTNEAERVFQYGSQGNDELNPDGGWVARINSPGGDQSAFPSKSVSFAIHTPWNPAVDKPGSQSTPTFPDPIATTRVFSDAEWAAGIDFVFAVDNSNYPAAFRGHIFYATSTDTTPQVVTDIHQQSMETWPLPGMSTTGPGNEQTSNGFVLFNQSVDYVSAPVTSPLKNCKVSALWAGTCRDYVELLDVAQFLHDTPNGDLSTILT